MPWTICVIAASGVYIVAYVATRGTILYFNKFAGLLSLPVFLMLFAMTGGGSFVFDRQYLRSYFLIYGIACLLLGAWSARSDDSPWSVWDVMISVGCNMVLLVVALAGTFDVWS